MNRWSLLLLSLPLAGCFDFTPFQGVWWIEVSTDLSQTLDCDLDIDHNFDEGEVPEIDDPEGYIVTIEGVGSPTGSYALITRGKGGINYVNWGGRVYTGGVTAGTLVVNWDDTWSGTTTGEYDNDYEYVVESDTISTDTLTFTKNPETGGMMGNSSLVSSASTMYVEDDEWDAQDIGVLPQIPSAQILIHEDGPPNQVVNSPNADDCDGGDCEITITEDCSQTVSFQAFYAGPGDDDLFEAVEGYNQPPGLP